LTSRAGRAVVQLPLVNRGFSSKSGHSHFLSPIATTLEQGRIQPQRSRWSTSPTGAVIDLEPSHYARLAAVHLIPPRRN
jgi:hypothetical protein